MTLACRSDPVPMLVTGAIVEAGVEKKLEKPRMFAGLAWHGRNTYIPKSRYKQSQYNSIRIGAK